VDGRSIAPTVLGQWGLEPLDSMHGTDLTGIRRLPLKHQSPMVGTIGGSFEADLDSVRILRRQASAYMQHLFGHTFYALAGHRDLLGRNPVGLKPVPYTLSEHLDPSEYENVDMDSDQLPANFLATIDPAGGRDPGPLAVTLNGRVVATTRAWKTDGQWMTGVILPDGGFRDGANLIGLYEIGSGG
jgi:hypothetical protein